MAKVLFVHGMRMQHCNGDQLRRRWHQALVRGLGETTWGKANPDLLPSKSDVELVFWGDLFRPVEGLRPADITKGRGAGDHMRLAYYAFLRGLVRAADALSMWDADGRPRGPVASIVNPLVYQSALYMNNGRVPNPDSTPEQGAFFQIQRRFEAKLTGDTRIVIGHSLGSVIAYEGLCRNPHKVDTFITIGSPIATPGLIWEPLRARLHRLLNHPPDECPPWPSVRQWLNFCAPADVWCAPVKCLADRFGNPRQSSVRVRDIEVVHGNPHDFVRTHQLTTYLKHAEVHHEIADVLSGASSSRARRLVGHG